MSTYILTKTQKHMVVDALNALMKDSMKGDYTPQDVVHLRDYIENPYSGSWMGKKNIRQYNRPMKVMGVDVSSSSTGLTVIEDGQLVESTIWKPLNKKALASDRLFEYGQWIGNKLYAHRPDLVAVTSTSFSRNIHTTRVISRYEGVTIDKAKLYSADVVEAKDSTARKLVLSRGNLSKEEAYQEVRLLEPDYPFLPFKKGGDDQTDAWVMAKAAPECEYSQVQLL